MKKLIYYTSIAYWTIKLFKLFKRSENMADSVVGYKVGDIVMLQSMTLPERVAILGKESAANKIAKECYNNETKSCANCKKLTYDYNTYCEKCVGFSDWVSNE